MGPTLTVTGHLVGFDFSLSTQEVPCAPTVAVAGGNRRGGMKHQARSAAPGFQLSQQLDLLNLRAAKGRMSQCQMSSSVQV